jgi:hypothetical protein
MWWFLIPLVLLGAIAVLFGLLIVLGRFRNGALLRPVIERLSRIGFMRRFFTRISTAALERNNPELASAMKKLSTVSANPNPQAVQKVMSRLSPSERRAYLEAAEEQGEQAPNRQARRRVERMQQQSRAPGARKRKRR